MYIGLADDCTIVASEPYGVVEETSSYIRMDGEQGGEIVVVSGDTAGTLEGVQRFGYDGTPHPCGPAMWSPPRSPPATSTVAMHRTSC